MSIEVCLVLATPDIGSWPFNLLTGSFEETARKAAELGYDGVELLSRDFDLLDQATIKKVLKQYGLKVPALVTGAVYGLDRLCLMSPDKEIERRAMRRLEGFLEFAGEYGAVVDIGLLRGRISDMPDRVRAEERLATAFWQAADYAARCGARITLEPINRFEGDFIHNAQDGVEWVARVNHPSFGLMLDTFHMNIEDASIETSVREAAECLWHMHVGDSNRLSPGRGHFDFPGMIQTLREVEYTGFLSAEHLAEPDPDTAAQDTIRYLRQIV
jgi:sugar phosphate isomerase/epimerase